MTIYMRLPSALFLKYRPDESTSEASRPETPETPNPMSETLNPKSETLNPLSALKPQTQIAGGEVDPTMVLGPAPGRSEVTGFEICWA